MLLKRFFIEFVFFYGVIILVTSCENKNNWEEDEIVTQCLLIEGECPRVMVHKMLEVFPEQPIDIEYYMEANHFTDIKIVSSENLYDNFIKKYIKNNSSKLGDLSYFQDDDLIVKPDEQYSFEITKNGKKSLIAQTKIPSNIPLYCVRQEDEIIDQEITRKYKISFTDIPNSRNYYYLLCYEVEFLQGYIGDSINVWNEKYLNNQDVNAIIHNVTNRYKYLIPERKIDFQISTLYLEGMLFNDIPFEGKDMEFTYLRNKSMYNEEYKNRYLIIELYHINEDFFKYYQKIVEQNFNSEESLNEPVQLYSNIENGYGIFAGAARSRKMIKLD